VGFARRDDGQRFWAALKERLQSFSLELHPDKTSVPATRAGSSGISEIASRGFPPLCSCSQRARRDQSERLAVRAMQLVDQDHARIALARLEQERLHQRQGSRRPTDCTSVSTEGEVSASS
jgi:hypothetical protein